MDLHLTSHISHLTSQIKISGSKSETNRMLILQALYPEITLENISDSDDSDVMRKALKSTEEIIDIHHAGTAMRFLTAYFSMKEGRIVTLTGSERMQQRPIKILVDALRQLGADIHYLNHDGFAPIRINGRKLLGNKVHVDANISSQYISAFILIGAKLPNGLEITLNGEITSAPYINMTLQLLNEIGIRTHFEGNKITIASHLATLRPPSARVTIESDWSSASYYYSIVALWPVGTQIALSYFKENSLQGDSALSHIYKQFGVETTFDSTHIIIKKSAANPKPSTLNALPLSLNLNDTPDLAQTIAVTCFALGIECNLTGLHTLKIKETDRIEALKTELEKLGAMVEISSDGIIVRPAKIHSNIKIETYNDHRMAMAFAPLAIIVPIVIADAEVISKSYPDFWKDLKSIGFEVSEIG